MEMQVSFPENLEVVADFDGFTVETDQPVEVGGDGTAPQPFALFLASIATCAGIYVLQFLRKRGLDTEQAGLALRSIRDTETGLVGTVEIDLRLPPEFPEKYRDAVVRAVNQCAVKRHLAMPPEFVVKTLVAA
ncbi:MAG: OsmC family protein [Actinobacteria bacterium]|nr:OsmC family protein [Actinomycetota bacterium]